MATLDIIFGALADPTRRRILAMLLEDDMAVTDVAAAFDISLSAVSKHLAFLDRAGLIARDKRGRVIWCRIAPEGLGDAALWLQSVGGVEPIHLDAFEAMLAALFDEKAPRSEAEAGPETPVAAP